MKQESLEEKAVTPEVPELLADQICEHDSFCVVKPLKNKAHCSKDYSKLCGQVKSFYDKYGEDYNECFI